MPPGPALEPLPPTAFALLLAGLVALWLALRAAGVRRAAREGAQPPPRTPAWLGRWARRPGAVAALAALAVGALGGALALTLLAGP